MSNEENADGIISRSAIEGVLPPVDEESITERREWFDEQFAKFCMGDHFRPTGGTEVGALAVEVRKAYSQGLFAATILLSYSIIENILADWLVKENIIEPEDAWMSTMIDKAVDNDIINSYSVTEINELGENIRENYAHYRHFNQPNSPTGREIRDQGFENYDSVEMRKEHAQESVEVMMKVSGAYWTYLDNQITGDFNPS